MSDKNTNLDERQKHKFRSNLYATILIIHEKH